MTSLETLKNNVLSCEQLKTIKPINGLLLADVGFYNPKLIPFIKHEIETNQKEVMSYLKHNTNLHNHYISTQLPIEYAFSIVLEDSANNFKKGDCVYTTKRTSQQMSLSVDEYLPNRVINHSDEDFDLCFVVGFYNQLDIVAKVDEQLFIETMSKK